MQAALARGAEDTAEVFLWCAWRCLEAMLRALLVPYPPRQFAELGVKGLLDDAVQRTLVPGELQSAFETIWSASQASIRVREHTPADRAKLVPDCAQALARAVRWFFERSPAKRPMPDEVVEGLAALAGGARVVSRDELARRLHARLIAELDALVAERRDKLAALGTAAEGLADHVAAERRSLEAAAARLEALRVDLAASEGYPRSWAGPPRSARRPAWAWSSILGPAIALAIGAVVGYLVREGAPQSWHRGRSTTVASRGAGDGDAAPAGRGDAADAGHAPVAADAGREPDAAPTRCPASMIEVAPAEVHLVQPYPRRSWPAGPKELPSVSVGRFCLDREPVRVASYEACVAKGACRARSSCLDQPRDLPVNCVSWADADAFCRWQGGALPSVAQWERTLLPGGTSMAKLADGTWEWTADPFPSQVFQRGPAKLLADGTVWGYMTLQKMFQPADADRPLCSWHKAPAAEVRSNLSFRCALEIAEPRP